MSSLPSQIPSGQILYYFIHWRGSCKYALDENNIGQRWRVFAILSLSFTFSVVKWSLSAELLVLEERLVFQDTEKVQGFSDENTSHEHMCMEHLVILVCSFLYFFLLLLCTFDRSLVSVLVSSLVFTAHGWQVTKLIIGGWDITLASWIWSFAAVWSELRWPTL